jgi:hypothetical protein
MGKEVMEKANSVMKKERDAATTGCSDGPQIPSSSFNPKTSPVFTEPRKQSPCSEPGK